MNLLCAAGLPGAESLDIPAALLQLDTYAAKVKLETDRHLYRAKDPRYAEHYAHSEARLRAEFIVQVLQEDCGVRYNPDRVTNPDFRDGRDLFIHGMLAGGNGGTCASMPVMYVAIGRRLGYPMKLVQAKEHLFCRWDDGSERFNIEASGGGGVHFDPDDRYRTWPKPISDAEMASGVFLTSLTPTQDLANFLHGRGACLHAAGRLVEARAAFAEAHRLEPRSANTFAALIATCTEGGPRGAPRRGRRGDDGVPDPKPGGSLLSPAGGPAHGPTPPGAPPTNDPKKP
ncbi:MAG: tetratricopeptide repeat protein [Phycisphaerales bacterium]|nr:tetratricopeptide repeat protein [Phycisphaerales bacterium]